MECFGYAIEILRCFAADKATTMLQAINVESGGKIDFLVASTEPTLSLVTIKDGRAVEVRNEGWIGDADGARAYLRFRQNLPMPQGLSEIEERLVRGYYCILADCNRVNGPNNRWLGYPCRL
jgi:hypothetical protein